MKHNEKHQAHLKHLLFLDCYSVHLAGMNHNAMDRCCVRERWEADLASERFEEIYAQTREQYKETYRNFDSDGSYGCEENVERYAAEQAESLCNYLNYKGPWTMRPENLNPKTFLIEEGKNFYPDPEDADDQFMKELERME